MVQRHTLYPSLGLFMMVIGLASRCLAQVIPAFSGADGAAALVAGGRGGLVYHVTKVDRNYSDNAVGTLRYGLTDSNFTVEGAVQPRTIVFDVAGTFWLGRFGEESGHDNGWDTQSRLNLGSKVTIAGQTAPGPVNIMGGVLKANGRDVVIRNVTIAPGYGMRTFAQPESGVVPTAGDFPDSYVYDAIDISGTNIMIDHVTTAYATDETISANEAAANVTIQYSNISQGQNYPQADAEASGVTYTGHALGSLLQGGANARFSVHHNLYAHQKGRLPRVGSEVGTGAYNDFRNNVFYNWLSTAGTGASGQPSFNNFVGNFWLAGPGGEDPLGGSSTAITTRSGGTSIFNGSNSSGTRVFHAGNLKDTNKDGDPNDGVALSNSDFSSSSIQGLPQWQAGQATYTGVTDTAAAARDRVLDYMGANWWTRDNLIDTLDERIIHEVRTGTGRIKAWADDPFNNDPNEGTEWRNLLAMRADPVTGAAPFSRPADWDIDGDGMPAVWEAAHALDPAAADNNGDFDADGYTNLEEYINELAAWPAPAHIHFLGGVNNRYAQISNWDVNSDPLLVGPWQPSSYDTAVVANGTVVVDAVGQHAGDLRVAPNPGDFATLAINGGWLVVADQLDVGGEGAGTVNHTDGLLKADAVVLGGGPSASGVYNLQGNGTLRTQLLSAGRGGALNFTGGTLSANVVAFDLLNDGGKVSPGEGIGAMRVLGDLNINDGDVEIDIAGVNDGQFDRLFIDGALTAGGRLEVTLRDGFAPRNHDVFQVLNFTSAGGSFDLHLPELDAGLVWDTSSLLISGALAVTEVGGAGADFDDDGDVDGSDFLVWQRGLGLAGETNHAAGDANLDGAVDDLDLEAWRSQFTSPVAGAYAARVPEPALGYLMFSLFLVGNRLPCKDQAAS